MTTIEVIPVAMRRLTASEMRAEMAWGLSILENAKRLAGMEGVQFRVEWNNRFTRRLGDSLVINRETKTGRLRFASTALYLRATAAEREAVWYHEAAHTLADIWYGTRCKHGANWKAMMRKLGRKPDRCHTVNRDGLRRGSRRNYRAPVEIHITTVPVIRPTFESNIREGMIVSWPTDGEPGVGRVVEVSGNTAIVFVVGWHQRARLGNTARVSVAACNPY